MLLSSLLEPRLAVGFLGHLVRAFSTAHSHIPREAKANMELLPSFPQQFPSSGYQPQIQPPEPLIRKVLGNVLKERTGGKRTVLVLRLFTASLIFQVSLMGVETDSFQKFGIVPVQV